MTNTPKDKENIEDWVSKPLTVSSHWLYVNFDDVFETLAINEFKIPQKEYLIEGKFPVIDQGATLIGGYTNDSEKVINNEGILIVFGDHTRCLKLVSFDFAPGADGIKVLKPRSILNSKYLYYACQSLKLPNRGYSRHFSFLRRSLIPLCPLNEQKRIVNKIEELFSELDKGIENLKNLS